MDLNTIANQLLDLGKRNRLLNYKDSGLKSVEILNRNYKEIYDNLSNGKDYFFLDTDGMIEKYHDVYDSPEQSVDEYSPLKVYDITKEALKTNQLAAYKKGTKLIKVLKALMKEYNFSINEKGINSLYITFGFVTYTEGKENYKAPLLLIPVEFTKNNSGIYKIHASDDDIILNPTLDYYFNTVRHFDMPDYSSVDFEYEKYMESVRTVFPEGVTYEDGISLGIYSFMKINMYKDLTDHEDKVLENKNVQTLLGTPSLSMEIPGGTVLPVVNCDSSQLSAIDMAVKGISFTLQGPPGSGKSQTITNIIASLIGNGRHVLFVSEKLQALQVVYNNLDRAGLADFALELHSSKANKKNFIDALYKTAVLPKYSVKNDAEDVVEEHKIDKAFIDSYMEALHTPVEGEKKTLYDFFSEYLSVDALEMTYKIKDISSYKTDCLPRIERALRDYKNSASPLGYDYKDMIFYGMKDLSMSYISYELEREFTDAISYLSRVMKSQEKLNAYIRLSGKEILTMEDMYQVFDFISAYNTLKYDAPCYYSKEKNEYVSEKAEQFLSTKDTCDCFKNYDKEVLGLELSKLYRTLKGYTNVFKVFSSEYRSVRRTILSYRDGKAKDDVLLSELKELIQLKENLALREKLLSEIREEMDFVTPENMKKIHEELGIIRPFAGITVMVPKKDCINSMLDELIAFNAYQKEDVAYKNLALRFEGEILDFFKMPLAVIESRLKQIYELREKVGGYSKVLSAIESIRQEGFGDFLEEYLKEGHPLDIMDKVFRRTFLQNKIFEIVTHNPIFAGFSSNLFQERVQNFNALDEKILKLNRDYIIAVNSQKRPDDVFIEGSKFKILAKEANKVRKQKPIRVLLGEIYDLALTIKPVFLMSPLSVSTYLTEDNTFDCVIFDEASQIFAQDAFGAIYRGKQCIIIGDSKQMPPTNFFNASADTEEEDDYESADESILDMASSTMTSGALKWHYRSRSEELIAFSNKAFYDNTLITIPQAKNHTKGFGIDFEFVSNGIYDAKSRTNIEEAKKISKMVFEHYRKSSQSLGVVAFSKVQADLIEDMIEEDRLQFPELNKYFTNEVDEPFFVKNLETVQGDERDRIIFSICYGYNKDGKFFQRFGPLNNLGGERRLNVAITRAKYNVTVVSSIHSSDIREGGTDSLGVKLLKEYLEFAENVEAKKNYSDTEDGVLLSVKQFLLDKQYEVYTNYGTSSFRIPLAVKESGHSECLAAIMTDSSYENKNTTDTNRLEKLLLERLGWKYYKLYSVAWIENRKIEEEKLLDFLQNSAPAEMEEIDTSSFIEETDTSLESRFDTYSMMPIDKLQECYQKKGLCYAMTELLKAEEPVTKEYFLKKAAEAMGKTRITNVVKNEVAKSMPENISVIGNSYWLHPKDQCTLRLNSPRMLDEIPMEELKSGLLTIITVSDGITVEGAYRTLLKLLGFSRLTDNAKKLFDDAIVFLKLDGQIVQRGECLFI